MALKLLPTIAETRASPEDVSGAIQQLVWKGFQCVKVLRVGA